LTAPVTVNPNSGMKYYGHILDLQDFNGPVTIKDSTFTSNILRYSSCAVGQQMTSGPVYSSTTDDYPSYGAKTVY
jgi:hypothetical protein